MFVVGAIAGVVGGVVLAHDDHSDYSDWAEYGDAGFVQQEEEAKEKEEQLRKQLKRSRDDLQEIYDAEMDKLEEKYGDIPSNPSDAEEFLDHKDKILNDMKNRLLEGSNEAQQRLNEIDAAIRKINNIQLTEKEK